MKPSLSAKFVKPIYNKILKNIPFIAKLSDEELDDFSRIIIGKTFSKNEVILMEEDTPNYMYIIYSGKIKAVNIDFDGKEHILAIHKSGDFFGEMALLDGKTAPATVIAMENSDIGLIRKQDFQKYLLKDCRILSEIISMLCSRLRDAWLMARVLSYPNAEQKVRAVLQHIGVQHGVKDQRGILISLKLTHKDIADYASVSRETVTRLLDRFIKEQDIELIDHKYILLRSSFLKKNTNCLHQS